MITLGLVLVGISIALPVYTYLGYPGLLWIAGLTRDRSALSPGATPEEWPQVSVSLPAYNEESAIRETLESWLSVDYPSDKLQIVVISDASTDRTDEIVSGFAHRGVELLRLESRSGKTAAENAAVRHLRGDVVVNTDASVRVRQEALKQLVLSLQDPQVGVASGRDVSVGPHSPADNVGEAGYVGYEMWVRRLETLTGGIIGASGCLYAIRPELHQVPVPPGLSRDFASALIACEYGLRAVSVEGAICLVPRAQSLRAEYRRKVRTMARGLATLWFKRRLMNPFRYGGFAFKLISHKLCRWLTPVAVPLSITGIGLLALDSSLALALFLIALLGLATGVVGLLWPEDRPRPHAITVAGYALGANVAALVAWVRALRGGQTSGIWEPTRRPGIERGIST